MARLGSPLATLGDLHGGVAGGRQPDAVRVGRVRGRGGGGRRRGGRGGGGGGGGRGGRGRVGRRDVVVGALRRRRRRGGGGGGGGRGGGGGLRGPVGDPDGVAEPRLEGVEGREDGGVAGGVAAGVVREQALQTPHAAHEAHQGAALVALGEEGG